MARSRELPPESGSNGNDGQDSYGMEVAEDGSSLMLCSPLIPQRDSLVEIAETEYVSFNEAGQVIAEGYRSPLRQVHTVDDVDEVGESEDEEGKSETHQATVDDEGEGSLQVAEGSSVENNSGEGQPNEGTEPKSIFRWPWSKTEEEKRMAQKAKEKKQVEAKTKEERKLKKKNEKLIWIPSPTKISLQTMWWGYRMSVNFQSASPVAH